MARARTRGLLVFAMFVLAAGTSGRLAAQIGAPGGIRPITSHNAFWDARRGVDADRAHPVALELVVAYYDPAWHLLWVENEGEISFLPVARTRLPMQSRQRVRLVGEVIPAEGLNAEKVRVTLIAEEVSPRATPGNGRLLDLARRRQSPVVVSGYVERQEEVDGNHVVLDLVIDDRRVRGTLWLDDGAPVPALGGQLVRAIGVCTVPAESLSDTADLQLWIARAGDIQLADGPRVAEFFALPEATVEQLATTAIGDRVRLAGSVTARDSGSALTLRTATGELLEMQTPLAANLSPGDAIEVVGFPVKRALGWTLRDVICRPQRGPVTATVRAEDAEALPKLRLAEQALHMMADEATRGYPVELTGIVTFSHPIFTVFFLQDGSGGLCVNYEGVSAVHPHAGETITVRGRTAVGGYATMVQASSITINGRDAMPVARPVTLEQALTGVEDAQWIEMRGFLRHIEMRNGLAYMTVVAAGGEFVMRVPATEPPPITVGSVLRASGVCASKPNTRRQLISVDLLVPALDHVIIDDAAPMDPFSRPLREISSLRRYQPAQTLDRQVRIHGVVLHHVPGRMLLVQGEGEVLRVLSRDKTPLAPGDLVDVVGVPGRIAAQLVLREAVYRRTGHGDEPEPLALSDHASIDPELDGRLVRLQGALLDVASDADETRLFVETGTMISEVVFEHEYHPAAAGSWSPGATIALTGIYRIQYDEYDQPQDFNVQVRAAADVAILTEPSWWTARRALMIAGLFFGLHLLGLVWAGTLRRRVRAQTNVIRTQLEHEASLEARHRDIIENASDFILTVDLNGRFTSFNSAGELLTGYPRPVAMRLSFYDLLEKRDARLVRWTLARPEGRRELVGFQTRFVRRDGSRVWVEANARFIRQNGVVTGMLGVVRDISARKQVEEELKLARDAAEANTRAKSLFLANMSHEIRTPMNGVIGMSHLLLDTGLDEQQRDFTETIRSSAEALLTVLNDILDFSKIEAGRLQFENLEFPLGETVDDALDLLAARAAAKNLELAAFLPADLPPRLRGDPGRLRQILLNLIGNAVKFTEHGEITVRVSRELETTEHVTLRFTITDTGVGIAPEAQKNLFQAFNQADNSMTRRFGGTGLGLVISKQIVELMHGQIGVESTLGQGATFWFTVRFDQAVSAGAMPAVDATALDCAWEGARVLVVDDHAVNQALVQHLLGPGGVRVVSAGDAASALMIARDAAVHNEPFQLILLDQQMPDIDGLTLAREFHGDPTLAGVPIVLLASLHRQISADVRAATGVVACLTKPIRQSELWKTIRRYARQPGDVAPVAERESADQRHEAARESDSPAGFALLRVLVAEDNVVNQRLTRLQLQKLGLHADIAADGREVLEAVERVPYDVILMDCQMPDIDGFEATRRLRANSRHAGLRIIAMTANAMTGDRERCLEVGMNDYLSKPTRLDDLRAALQRSLDSAAKK